MTKITALIAQKLLRIIAGESIAHSQLQHPAIQQMIEEGVLQIQLQGRTRKRIFALNPEAIAPYLTNHHGINNLELYIQNLENGALRAENIIASSDSKSTNIRTFKGFLVNSISPISAQINEQELVINPPQGSYVYIHDYESFAIDPEILIVGVENSENFRYIHAQTHLFSEKNILFVSRYPQSGDLIHWLKNIPNRYLHFGDFDFAGICIFHNEYQKHLPNRSSFFIPKNIEPLLRSYGNKRLYNLQYQTYASLQIDDEINPLIKLFHQYKKCLEQEVLIKMLSAK